MGRSDFCRFCYADHTHIIPSGCETIDLSTSRDRLVESLTLSFARELKLRVLISRNKDLFPHGLDCHQHELEGNRASFARLQEICEVLCRRGYSKARIPRNLVRQFIRMQDHDEKVMKARFPNG